MTTERSVKRVERLREEARNCISTAIAAHDPDFTAALVNEARKLMRRAKELADRP